ncbi:MAG: pseudouridine synthase [bacterium]
MNKMRLQKFLSHAGVASRRAAETMIEEGRVKVNGKVCKELGTQIDAEKDKVEVDGRVIEGVASLIYLLINKPQGYITTLDDPEGRPIITDLIPANMPRVYPVGRLDWDSDGAVLMTNDGDLTNLLTHPSHEIDKTYAVKINGTIEEHSKELKTLREGVEIEPGVITKPAVVKIGRQTDKNTWLEFRISEGRNRQIRKMCEAVGFRVSRLRRVAIGPLTIKGVRSGQFRALDTDEVRSLYNAVGKRPPELAEPSRRARKREEQNRRYGRPKARSVKQLGDKTKTETSEKSAPAKTGRPSKPAKPDTKRAKPAAKPRSTPRKRPSDKK